MTNVFVLQHVHRFDDEDENVKMIGAYSSEEQAAMAIERLVSQPGFRDQPDGFYIDRYEIDRDHWSEGYVTL